MHSKSIPLKTRKYGQITPYETEFIGWLFYQTAFSCTDAQCASRFYSKSKCVHIYMLPPGDDTVFLLMLDDTQFYLPMKSTSHD